MMGDAGGAGREADAGRGPRARRVDAAGSLGGAADACLLTYMRDAFGDLNVWRR